MPFNEHWVWFAVMIVCLIIEAGTMGLTTIWFAIGALVSIFVSFTGISMQFQVLLFLMISLALLILTRPFVSKKLKIKKIATNADALIGRVAVVTKEITLLNRGEVKIDGKFWTAKPQDDSAEFVSNEHCVITSIEGVTVVVAKEK